MTRISRRTVTIIYINTVSSKKVSKIPLLFQYFKHSLISIVSGSICPLSQLTVQRASEKTLSGSSLISEIESISIAINKSLGQRYFCVSLLECALTLARDLAYIWPRCPHPILSVCNSSISLNIITQGPHSYQVRTTLASYSPHTRLY
jgi:hypothetical protein